MTKEKANNKAKELLSKCTLDQLIDQWEAICNLKATSDIVNVRGWLLEELEAREPEKMDKFYDDFNEDMALRSFLK